MASYIARNEPALTQRHYVMNATGHDYFFNFYAGQVAAHREQFGERFCLIINGSMTEDDAYVLPFAQFAAFFSEDYIDTKGRWLGHIRLDRMILNRKGLRPKTSESIP